MSQTTTTGEPCVECDPEAFAGDPRPKLFLPLCKKHLEEVAELTTEQIEAAIKRGQEDYEACLAHEPSFIPPRGFFR